MFWKSSGSKNLWFRAIENWRFWKSSESKNLQFQVCDENFQKKTKPLVLGFSEKNFKAPSEFHERTDKEPAVQGRVFDRFFGFLRTRVVGHAQFSGILRTTGQGSRYLTLTHWIFLWKRENYQTLEHIIYRKRGTWNCGAMCKKFAPWPIFTMTQQDAIKDLWSRGHWPLCQLRSLIWTLELNSKPVPSKIATPFLSNPLLQ